MKPSAQQKSRLTAAFSVSEAAVVSFELRDASGGVVAAVRRSGLGPMRMTLEVDASSEREALSAWLSVVEAEHVVAITDIRFDIDDPTGPSALDQWTLAGADRIGNDIVVPAGGTMTLTSPPFDVEGGLGYLVDGEALVQGEAEVHVWFDGADGRRDAERVFTAKGDWAFACPCRSAASGPIRIMLSLSNRVAGDLCILRAPRISLRELPRWTSGFEDVETALPHWNRWQLAIHRRCKTSRSFNGLLSAVEMRLGRKELLSLPQYMAICPTGQCNALCAFCSVTVNRTGIIKRQLQHDVLSRFVAPVRKSVRVFGLEGNGEPTLYREFLPLVGEVTSGGTNAYLITNASRLDRETLKHLVLLESVNISLNAATAETHRKVMKLKDFQASVTAIKRLVSMRGKRSDGWNASPRISVSFVVTADNIHEVQDFLAFAEDELGVDVAYIRPLSELGNDLGVVEDVRRIVPFDSDIDDMLESIDDYIHNRRRRLDIRFDARTFRSTRPDPAGQIVMPCGYEQRLLAPRRTGWTHARSAIVAWTLSRARLCMPKGGGNDSAMISQAIPVMPDSRIRFEASIHVISGELLLLIADADNGAVLASTVVSEDRAPRQVAVVVDTGQCRALVVRFEAASGVVADIDFGRIRRPAPFVGDAFMLPGPPRWERGVADVAISWEQRSVTLESAAAPGLYLLRSFNSPCAPGRIVHLPVKGMFTRGAVGIGVLSSDGSRFLAVSDLSTGEDQAILTFHTGGSRNVAIAVYGLLAGGTAGTLTFGEPATELDPDWRPELEQPLTAAMFAEAQVGDDSEQEAAEEAVQAEPSEGREALRAPPRRPIAPRRAVRRTWKRRLRDFIMGRDRVYCHKPWTDMHNFSVDGRVDVCCIATGPSQEYYQLGNLMNQSFQEVWNGERAKEFRRTVNSDQPLPPCARCPMSHAYQGQWFDPVHTMGQFRSLFFSREILNRRYTRYIGYAGYYLGWIVLQFAVFRGFRRHPLAGLGRLGEIVARKFGI
jgi:radical SAM protein with 4Fe4S-binding SPASM domain